MDTIFQGSKDKIYHGANCANKYFAVMVDINKDYYYYINKVLERYRYLPRSTSIGSEDEVFLYQSRQPEQ